MTIFTIVTVVVIVYVVAAYLHFYRHCGSDDLQTFIPRRQGCFLVLVVVRPVYGDSSRGAQQERLYAWGSCLLALLWLTTVDSFLVQKLDADGNLDSSATAKGRTSVTIIRETR